MLADVLRLIAEGRSNHRRVAGELSGGGIVEPVMGFASYETEAFLQGPLAQGRHPSPRGGARRT